MADDNPFLDRRFDIQWNRLTPELIAPAIEVALADALAALEAIATQDRATVTLASSIEALESATDALNEAWGKVTHLTSVCDSPEVRSAYNSMLPKVTEFYASIHLNGALWDVMKAFASTPEANTLIGVRKRLFDETIADFKQAGANLEPAKKSRLEQLESELASLTQKFSENVLDATNAWELVVDDESRIDGLPAHAKDAARRSAESKGHGDAATPKWRFTLHQPSQEPVMTHALDESLRREVWDAAVGVGARAPHDNHDLIRQILKLRQEKAEILGKSAFPDLVLERRMAKSGAAALRFVEEMHARVKKAFDRECRELEEFKAAKTGSAAATLAPWEVAFWAEKLRKDRFDFDEEALRPYFPLDRVIEGLFAITERIFGVKAVAREKGAVDTWHSEVRFYDLKDVDGRQLGSFYTDWHPRESKRSGAWMNYLITGVRNREGRTPHLGLMCGNMTPPAGDKPALLTHREVETVFHEFGHLLHHLLGEVEYKSLNGVNVSWDFVELPSQIMENWAWEPEGLDLFGRHFETGGSIPDALFAKMKAARNFRTATATVRQLAFGKMDLELHLRPKRFVDADLDAEIEKLLCDYIVPTNPTAPSTVCRFGHLFSDPVGYAAGYYSYKWAEVLDADAFTRFKERGILDAETGRAFRKHVLSRGNSEPPEALFRRFMGRDADINALLIRNGLVEA
ncbi:MAG TPA: M3 family metallopeptidase [Opitutaceae bacterium]|nr:M3 family metallopeptidase [Opitutaceae bacterium]